MVSIGAKLSLECSSNLDRLVASFRLVRTGMIQYLSKSARNLCKQWLGHVFDEKSVSI